MTTHSLTRGQFYKTIAIALSIALVCSLIPSKGWGLLFGIGVAHAAPDATGLASALPDGVNSAMAQVLQNAMPAELANQLSITGSSDPAIVGKVIRLVLRQRVARNSDGQFKLVD